MQSCRMPKARAAIPTITITLRVSPELYDALSKDPRTQHKSLNQSICDALIEWLNDNRQNKSRTST